MSKESKKAVDVILVLLKEEVQNTRWYRAAKVKPGHDSSDFSSVPASSLIRLERWITELEQANSK